MDETNTIVPNSVELKSLTKQELIQMINNLNNAAKNYEISLNDARKKVEDIMDERQKDHAEFDAFAQRVDRVVAELKRHYETRINIIFNTINNLQTLLKEPDYKSAINREKEEE